MTSYYDSFDCEVCIEELPEYEMYEALEELAKEEGWVKCATPATALAPALDPEDDIPY